MKTFLYSLLITAFFVVGTFAGSALAQAAENRAASSHVALGHAENNFSTGPSHPWDLNRQDGLTYRFAGDREDGAFQFFLRRQDDTAFIQDPTADDLNRIEPAVGVQLKMGF